MAKYIKTFDEISLADVPLVGGKNASLGELVKSVAIHGIQVPHGFCVTATAYRLLIEEGKIKDEIEQLLSGADKGDLDDFSSRARACRTLIKKAGIPAAVAEEIRQAYRKLNQYLDRGEHGHEVDVAVRSSATAEDLPDASFAGQQETFLNIRGEDALLEACLNCFASLFTDRAVSYRIDKGFDHMAVSLSIGVQKMVRSDLSSSGVIFTLDTESGFRDVVLVTSTYGLGENIVAGRVDPDEFLVFKTTLQKGFDPILRRRVGAKQYRMIYSGHGTRTTRNIEVRPEDRERFSISDAEVLKLAHWACTIEHHYSELYGRPTAMDIEWAKDGNDGHLYIVQARPETIHSSKETTVLEAFRLETRSEVLVTGRSIGERIGAGPVRTIGDASELGLFKDGEVLVADMTDPDWEPIMKRASAIVTNRGGRTCHAAIVSRELKIPCIVGCHNATGVLRDGDLVTVSCAEGETGNVYKGRLSFTRNEIDLKQLPETRTEIMVNVGNPDQALALAQLPVKGVGLAREEFIIANEVGIHPLALTRFDELQDVTARSRIEEITRLWPSKEDYFVDKLAEGIGTIAAAFYPRPVIVRLSDFKTNEYANLLGGAQFEPAEANPMIGFRGASRYYDQRYRDGFALECRALLKVRKKMGLVNVKVMVPFCRTPEEGKLVIDEMARNGLKKGEDDLEVYAMCELPSNVLLMAEFANIFDGFSIGSNDLTQLILGVDRDSEVMADLFDERQAAVKKAIAMAVDEARAHGRKIGLCGQAPSDYPEFVRFLIELGIDSISLNEDAVIKTILLIAAKEVAKR